MMDGRLKVSCAYLRIYAPVNSPATVLPAIDGTTYAPASPIVAFLVIWKYRGMKKTSCVQHSCVSKALSFAICSDHNSLRTDIWDASWNPNSAYEFITS
jgi:hypothetical protein